MRNTSLTAPGPAENRLEPESPSVDKPSVLFPPGEGADELGVDPPVYFADLNLDAIVSGVVAGRDQYRLEPFFAIPLRNVESVTYRHAVMRDLERGDVSAAIATFAAAMREIRTRLDTASDRHRAQREREAWGLEAAGIYQGAVIDLAESLAELDIESEGLRAFAAHLDAYRNDAAFVRLSEEVSALRHDLAEIRYALTIEGAKVTVSRYSGETDYSLSVLEVFARFQGGAVSDDIAAGQPADRLNPVESRVLDLVASLFPDRFARLAEFWAERRDFIDDTVARFDREIQFYVAYQAYMSRLTSAGLRFCYPEVASRCPQVIALETFDLALADKLTRHRQAVVCNDLELAPPERIVVVTGPNQGGKTTFARTIGQLHHLARLGCPVPGVEAKLMLCDEIFTHFEQGEDISTLTGKLESDLLRIKRILEQATSKSLVVMNESFSSTSLEDARFLGGEILTRLVEIGTLCVYVTFIDELSRLSPATVSIVSTVDPDDPAIRTFKLVRRPADGAAYASAIAAKYGLTYKRLREQIR